MRMTEEELEPLLRLARTGSSGEVQGLLMHPHHEVQRAIIANPNLHEFDRLRFLRRRDLLPDVLKTAARSRLWEEYSLKVAIVRNHRTPLHVATKLLHILRLFDLVDVLHLPAINPDLKLQIEQRILRDLPKMTLGVQITLARRASPAIIEHLLEAGQPKLVEICLDNPRLSELTLVKTINLVLENPLTLRYIASHSKWANRLPVRFALSRHAALPEGYRRRFMGELRDQDLEEIVNTPHVCREALWVAHEEIAGRRVRRALERRRSGKTAKKSADEIRGVSPSAYLEE